MHFKQAPSESLGDKYSGPRNVYTFDDRDSSWFTLLNGWPKNMYTFDDVQFTVHFT